MSSSNLRYPSQIPSMGILTVSFSWKVHALLSAIMTTPLPRGRPNATRNQAFPENFAFSVSHTTRKPREGFRLSFPRPSLTSKTPHVKPCPLQLEGEQNGVHYNFTHVPDMEKDIADGIQNIAMVSRCVNCTDRNYSNTSLIKAYLLNMPVCTVTTTARVSRQWKKLRRTAKYASSISTCRGPSW